MMGYWAGPKNVLFVKDLLGVGDRKRPFAWRPGLLLNWADSTRLKLARRTYQKEEEEEEEEVGKTKANLWEAAVRPDSIEDP